MGVVATAALLLLVPDINRLKSARSLAQVLATQLGEGEVYGIHPWSDGQFLFYTERLGRELGSEEELRRFAREGGRLVVARRENWRHLPETMPYH